MKFISALAFAAVLAAAPAFAQHRGVGHMGVVRGPVYSMHGHVAIGHGVWPGYRVTYPYRYPYYYPFSAYYGCPYAYYGYPYYRPYPYYYGYFYPYFAYPYVYVH